MILKKINVAYRYSRLISKHKSVVLLNTTNIVKSCSTTIKKKNEYKFDGPSLKDFIAKDLPQEQIELVNNEDKIPYVDDMVDLGQNRKVYIEVYGCQMNVNDAEIVWSILQNEGYIKTNSIYEADVILLVTCAIRDSAENKIWTRIKQLRSVKRWRGCMAERLKEKLVSDSKGAIDLVAGPDSYRDLPRLLAKTEAGQKAINVLLSFDETYAEIKPVKLNDDNVTAYVSIMRGCDNMCTYCIVPFTRGRERSRPVESILDEIKYLSEKGFKEVTLLGQNVNSYRDLSTSSFFMPSTNTLASGFKTVYKEKKGGVRFAELLNRVSDVDPEMRIRFTSPHPKDFPDEVLDIILEKPNVCKNLHLPAQCGSTEVLEKMRRGYTRESYLSLAQHIRDRLPGVTYSSDFIAGFCGETDEEFEDTISLMETVKYHNAFLFAYSMREKTTAYRRYKDDVPHEIKVERVKKMFNVFRRDAEILNKQFVNTEQLMLVEGESRRGPSDLCGRTDGNIKVIIPNTKLPLEESSFNQDIKPGDYITVKIIESNSQVLKGMPLKHTGLQEYEKNKNKKNTNIY
ncbi:CDK5 regulatory subunit-associated protein 1 isoform X2 [Acyrthosiphon pisum]|uniref:CDK5RAP1-like protein n=1 Tax=Acyrthosiphon pisum TaxID=7029 RepID=A0A8R2F987_ACYPI|nr:CDK5 regulatory subunit-associated protein 1 isoform X2 [Acyrthosiphon pisum]|eukprot:XP_008184115.1 PREDICTED: CDK5 regulatory subunit-associated protein 1 isoform X2 [Acyrthosiphon pisum]